MRESGERAGEGSRIVEKGLERGGVGKREYLAFLSSIGADRIWGKQRF